MPRRIFRPGVGFPHRFLHLVARKQLTLTEVAERADVRVETLSNWTRRIHYPEQRRFYRVCEVLGVKQPRDLLRSEGEPPLTLVGEAGARLRDTLSRMERTQQELGQLTNEDLGLYKERLLEGARAVRAEQEKRSECRGTTPPTTESET